MTGEKNVLNFKRGKFISDHGMRHVILLYTKRLRNTQFYFQ